MRFYSGLCIRMIVDNRTVRICLISRYDLSGLADGLSGFILQPVNDEDARRFGVARRARRKWVRPRLRGNLLEVSERAQLLTGAPIGVSELRVRRLGNMASTRVRLFTKQNEDNRKICYRRRHIPTELLDIDFGASAGYMKRSIPRYVSIEKTSHLLASQNVNALFSVETFPYLPPGHYLDIDHFDFDKHSFVIGSTGSGKSKFIELFIHGLRRSTFAHRYHVVVIDPHVALAHDLLQQGSAHHIDFRTDTTQMFPDARSDISAATELTVSLLKSLIGEDVNPRLDRVLRFAIYVLNVAQVMSLDNLKRFLTEVAYRTRVLSHVSGFVTHSIEQFFATDFNELRTNHHSDAIQPIIALVDELALQPAISGTAEATLAQTISENFLTIFSLNKISMGDKAVKTVAGLLIQQIFLLAQAHAFSRNVILIIDEVSVVQNPTMASILAEARKFGLSVMMSQQYFDQIEVPLQRSILSNTTNYYVFRVSESDAETLAGNILIEFPSEEIERERRLGNDEMAMRVSLMSELSPRECLVRVGANGKTLPAVLAKTCNVEVSNRRAVGHISAPMALPVRFEDGEAISERQPDVPLEIEIDQKLRAVFGSHSVSRKED